MKIISTGAADILMVYDLPADAHSFEIKKTTTGKASQLYYLVNDNIHITNQRLVLLPKGYNYTILGRAGELTKLECKSIVKFVGLPWCAYKDYTTPRNWHSCPVRSFHSLLESQGILLENPYEKPHPLQVLALGTTKYIALDNEWHEAQSKVKYPVVIKAEKIT